MQQIRNELTNGLSRRHFMRASAAATMAALTGSAPRLAASPAKLQPKADCMILRWVAG